MFIAIPTQPSVTRVKLTAWFLPRISSGAIPMELIDLGEKEGAEDAQILKMCTAFGEVVACTVAKKYGKNKSWALVSFTDRRNL